MKSQMLAERGDITTYQVDAIVNAANPFLERGGGVCGAIFRAAGAEELEEECARIMEKRNHEPLEHGECAITSGCRLAAKYVIHAVGPIWEGGNAGEEKTLERCYQNILRLCEQKGIKTVAIPAISTGYRSSLIQTSVPSANSIRSVDQLQSLIVHICSNTYGTGNRQNSIRREL